MAQTLQVCSNAIKSLVAAEGRLFCVCASTDLAWYDPETFALVRRAPHAHERIANGGCIARTLFSYMGCLVSPEQICVSDADHWTLGGPRGGSGRGSGPVRVRARLRRLHRPRARGLRGPGARPDGPCGPRRPWLRGLKGGRSGDTGPFSRACCAERRTTAPAWACRTATSPTASPKISPMRSSACGEARARPWPPGAVTQPRRWPSGSRPARDPRISTLDPPMVEVAGGRAEIGLDVEQLDAVLARYGGLGLERKWFAKECPRHAVRGRGLRRRLRPRLRRALGLIGAVD